jgi:hypothetical protein
MAGLFLPVFNQRKNNKEQRHSLKTPVASVTGITKLSLTARSGTVIYGQSAMLCRNALPDAAVR